MLLPHAQELGRRLLEREVMLSFRSGWLKGMPLAEALQRSWEADWERGNTSVGPQRAELHVQVDGVTAKDEVSRGQQKLLAAALLLAQLRLFGSESPVKPTLLLDDPAAELDQRHLELLIESVQRPDIQLVVTSLSESVDILGKPGLKLRISEGETRPF